MTNYKILWDNGVASDVFPYVFTNKRKAETWAREWKREMVAVEATANGRRDARRLYEWEVIEAPQEPEEDFSEEQSLDYFNHYIAGDR